MNILILSWRGIGHPNQGGAEISTHEHAKGWIKKGHKVTLFTSFYKGAKKQEVIDGVNIKRSGDQILGVHIEAIKWYLFLPHEDFDIVIDQFHGIPFFTPLFVKIKKIAFIHEVAKDVWQLNHLIFPFNLIVGNIGKFIEPLIFRLYKKINFMTVSDSTKKELMEWGIMDNKITVINNGTSLPPFKVLPKKEDKKTLIFLGALTKDKGIDIALDTFSKLKTLDKGWQFWVVGKGEYGFQKLEKNIKFFGYVDENKKFELLAKSHLLIHPSIREGWGLVVIEAASVATPTIAFNVTGLKDSIINNKTGILNNEQSAQALVYSIINLLEDEKRYSQMSHEAYLWSKNFSWEKSSNASLDLIKKIVG